MYVPRFNALEDAEELRALVAAVGSAQLVTVGADGYPLATLLPVIWDQADDGEPGGGRLVFHLARANSHWRAIEPGAPALAVVTGPEAYVSPAWYASKAEPGPGHGRVVPTWNYSAVELRGRVEVHDDAAWLLEAVTRLTDLHEQPREQPWAVTDAPETYVEKQLRAIVGVEMTIESVTGKAKLSQNRSPQDRRGVVTGLRTEGSAREASVANAMEGLG